MTAPRFRRQLTPRMWEYLQRSDGHTVAELTEALDASITMVRRSVRELLARELVWPSCVAMPYDEPWPALEGEQEARVLRQLRRKPRTARQLSESMAVPFDGEVPGLTTHRGIMYRVVAQLRGAGHVAPSGRVWLRTTRRARRHH